jgi:hypothetical protein
VIPNNSLLLKLILDGRIEEQYLQIILFMFIISMELTNASHFFGKFCIDKGGGKI